MKTIHAIYENGVFRPLDPVDLPEHSRVLVEPEQKDADPARADSEIWKILSRSYPTGEHDDAERHNEHQP